MTNENLAKPQFRQFFGRRKGHTLSPRQNSLLEDVLPKYELSFSGENNSKLSLADNYPEPASPTWLEIGFGKGEHLCTQATNNPHVNFIGCEPFVNGVVSLVDSLQEQNQTNVRIYPDDACDVLNALPEASIDRAFLLHPDPWPKRKHEKRRFVCQDNLDSLARVLKDGAEFRIGTDHVNYSRWTMFQMYQTPHFIWNAERVDDWKVRPSDWPETRYQQKAQNIGVNSVYLSYTRKPR